MGGLSGDAVAPVHAAASAQSVSDDLAAWLKTCGLAQYEPAFAGAAMRSVNDVATLGDGEIKQLTEQLLRGLPGGVPSATPLTAPW